jgi:hypothetical protein
MTNHLTAAEHITELSDRIQRLIAEIQQLRQQNATLMAHLVKLPTTAVTPEELAQAIIANCPRWRAVGLALVYHAMEKVNDLE